METFTHEIIETLEDGSVRPLGQCNEEDVKRHVRNIQRRVGTVGTISARLVAVENDHVAVDMIDEADPDNGGYITFAEAAELLGIRYQQVFQKAVVKGKLRWQQTTANFVALADIRKWAQERAERKAKAE
jgi:hypothetical protein